MPFRQTCQLQPATTLTGRGLEIADQAYLLEMRVTRLGGASGSGFSRLLLSAALAALASLAAFSGVTGLSAAAGFAFLTFCAAASACKAAFTICPESGGLSSG